jgi:murein L,D-transpeptidase YafK
MEGDRQIPEGFYRISHFNPKSNFLLSLKVNYPNVSDVILSDATSPGSDIYVHGGCQTTGCIPLTNDKIQELYLLAVEAHEEGKSIPFHIFPTKKFEENLNEDDEHFSFWENLKPGFDFFEENKKLPTFKVNSEGEYTFQN